jgi:hypothetical protein
MRRKVNPDKGLSDLNDLIYLIEDVMAGNSWEVHLRKGYSGEREPWTLRH